jgi:hypothetical protein
VNATGLTRQFFQFALGCGYAPQSVIAAFEMLADEYNAAFCYDEASNREE